MKYRKLASTGTSVSNLALGAMEFGTKVDEGDSFAILDRFVEAGGNLIDTANVYGGGTSEELLGRWFASRPADITERVVLATKARFGTGPDVNEAGTGRRNLDRALTASLRRLGLEKIDLYQMHGWDPLTPIEETLGFLDDAVHAGKIHYIGLSNFTGWQLQLTLSTAAALGLQLPVTLQQQYSLVCRENEYEVIPAALHNDIGLLPWSPLASGFLTGKYEQDAKPPQRRPDGLGQPVLQPDAAAARRQAAELGHPRRRPRHRRLDRRHAQPGRPQLGDQPTLGGRPHHRGEQPRAARRTSPAPTSSSTKPPPSASTTSAPPPRRLPLRTLRREATRPLRPLQRASHP